MSVFAALATVTGAQMFAGDDPVHSFLSAIAVLGVGFLLRPPDALFSGHITEVHRRHEALPFTIVVMGLSTLSPAVFCVTAVAVTLLTGVGMRETVPRRRGAREGGLRWQGWRR